MMNQSVPVETKGDSYVAGQYPEAGAVHNFHHPVSHRDQTTLEQVIVAKANQLAIFS
jgi:hypothetical protein